MFSTAVGSIFFSALVTVLVFAGWIKSTVCWSILGASLLIGWKNLLHLKVVLNIFQGTAAQRHAGLKNLAQSFLALLAFLSIGLAMAPAFATDALVYHLAVPKVFLHAEGLVNLPDNIYSFFPQQIEMLYLFALALGTESLAQLTGLGIVFLLLLSLWHYSSKKMEDSYAWLTPLIFFSTPTFFSLAASAYVELQAATYIFLGFYCWENGCKRKQTRWFILMTLLAGAAVTTKLTSVIILPLALLGLAIHGRTQKNVNQTAIQSIILALGALLIISPWLARNYFFTGNPLAPFFMNIFGGESGMNWDVTRSQMQLKYYSSFGMGHGILDFLSLPINLIFFSELNSLKFDGKIGILYLLLLPALLGLDRKNLPAMIVFSVLLVFWFLQMQSIRLLAPALVFLSFLMISGLEQVFIKYKSGKIEKFFLTAILALGILFNTSAIIKEWFHVNPLSFLLKKETREQFLTRQIKAYPSYDDANKFLTEKDKVLMVHMGNLGYLMNRPFSSDTFIESHTLSEIIDKGVYAADIINRLKARGITHVLFDFNYVFGKDSKLTIGERAIFKNFLIKHGEKLSAKNGFLLYRFMLDSKTEKQTELIPLNH
ncbi:MAG: glycosyltransferase family 39 protein [Nitrospinota bacterium]|nr:glycosyltransferase family 39 protein [Nitrospinota bacterium]